MTDVLENFLSHQAESNANFMVSNDKPIKAGLKGYINSSSSNAVKLDKKVGVRRQSMNPKTTQPMDFNQSSSQNLILNTKEAE